MGEAGERVGSALYDVLGIKIHYEEDRLCPPCCRSLDWPFGFLTTCKILHLSECRC